MTSLKCKIKVKVYDCVLEFIVTDEIMQQYSKICKKYKMNPEYTSLDGVFLFPTNGPSYYLIIALSKLTHNTIAHEVYHAATRICDHRDIEDEETKAWLAGYLTQEVYLFLEKKQQKVKHV
jgi:hypothetical protein